MASLDFGVPATLVAEAVFARSLSAAKNERSSASQHLKGPSDTTWPKNQSDWRVKLRQALYAAKIISYGQGFRLLQQASIENDWHLNFAGIAQMWQGGCIIRRQDKHGSLFQISSFYYSSVFLDRIRSAFLADASNAGNLLLDAFFLQALTSCSDGWRSVVAQSVLTGIPTPALSSALAYYDGLRCAKLPANLIQAQRDYFGAHTYELESNPGMFIHTNWTGRGGNVSSSNYKA
jgi:6-phosphogluconate dehydrogenase